MYFSNEHIPTNLKHNFFFYWIICKEKSTSIIGVQYLLNEPVYDIIQPEKGDYHLTTSGSLMQLAVE